MCDWLRHRCYVATTPPAVPLAHPCHFHSAYSCLGAPAPTLPGKVDALPLGAATVAVLKDKRVARQGTFTGAQEVEP
ncbi:MAG: hypothetical protein M3461_09285 [Pseudomonadota bacterium]|nr:hypothetical protein [Pseudomonadota bacterium]